MKKHRLDVLKKPLMIIQVENGMLACGYLNVSTFNATQEACVTVSGVNNFDDMLLKVVGEISTKARELGVTKGDTGQEALDKMS